MRIKIAIKQFTIPIDLHIISTNILLKSMGTINILVTNVFQNSNQTVSSKGNNKEHEINKTDKQAVNNPHSPIVGQQYSRKIILNQRGAVWLQ